MTRIARILNGIIAHVRGKLISWFSAYIGFAGLLIAFVGIWGAWIYYEAVGLDQNAFYLAEWSTYLLDVRYGGLGVAPEVLRLGVALGGLAGSIGLASAADWRLRWAIRLALTPIGLNLLPPYPDVFSLWWSPSYGGRFMAASVFWLGWAACLWLDKRGTNIKIGALTLCGLGAIISAGWAYSQLIQPFQAHYAATLWPGWGLVAFVTGLAIVLGVQLRDFAFTLRNQKGAR